MNQSYIAVLTIVGGRCRFDSQTHQHLVGPDTVAEVVTELATALLENWELKPIAADLRAGLVAAEGLQASENLLKSSATLLLLTCVMPGYLCRQDRWLVEDRGPSEHSPIETLSESVEPCSLDLKQEIL